MQITQEKTPKEKAEEVCVSQLIEFPDRLKNLLLESWAKGEKPTQSQKMYCGFLDSLEAEFRFYMSGIDKTLRNVYDKIEIISRKPQATCLNKIDSVFQNVERIIIGAEFYEAMPKFKRAKNKILKHIKKHYAKTINT